MNVFGFKIFFASAKLGAIINTSLSLIPLIPKNQFFFHSKIPVFYHQNAFKSAFFGRFAADFTPLQVTPSILPITNSIV